MAEYAHFFLKCNVLLIGECYCVVAPLRTHIPVGLRQPAPVTLTAAQDQSRTVKAPPENRQNLW